MTVTSEDSRTQYAGNGETTVNFDYTATTAKIVAVIGDTAEALFDRGRGDHGTEEEPIVFGDLSNQDKLDIVDEYVKDVIVNMANQKLLDKAKDAVEVEKHSI